MVHLRDRSGPVLPVGSVLESNGMALLSTSGTMLDTGIAVPTKCIAVLSKCIDTLTRCRTLPAARRAGNSPAGQLLPRVSPGPGKSCLSSSRNGGVKRQSSVVAQASGLRVLAASCRQSGTRGTDAP